MAQANLAQREPSMEEILASIRRIIEDSDTVRKTLPDEEPERDAASLRAEAANTQPRESAEVEDFRDELRGTSAREEPTFGPEPDDEPQESDLDSDELDAAFAAIGIAETAPAAKRAPEPAPREEPFARLTEPQPIAASRGEMPAAAPASSGKPVVAAPAETPEDRRPAIISDAPGRQVAAAFGELSAAFSANRSRSFDEMAEEMMRPMLQDWLDNNLPTLVERLVREEIERIARGGTG